MTTEHLKQPSHRRTGSAPLACALALLTSLSASVLAQTPTVLTDHATYLAGQDINVAFTGGPGNAKDWVGIYPDGVVPGSVNSTRWYYVDNTQGGAKGLTEGTLSFAGGLNTAGDWTGFLLQNDGYTVLAETKFKVLDPSYPLVQTDRRTYLPDQAITIAFTNSPAGPKDWIGFYPADKTPGSMDSLMWLYVPSGNGSGSLSFPKGLANAGAYVVYLLSNDGYDVLASEPFSVVPPVGLPARLLTIKPSTGATNQPPQIEFLATFTNGSTKVVTSSIQLTLDGAKVSPVVVEKDGLVTIAYTNQTLFASGSAHGFELTLKDNGSPAASLTNVVNVGIATYQNVALPAPLYFENFDTTDEGKLPTGWRAESYSAVENAEFDLGNLDSASYATWVVVNADRFKGTFVTYSNPEGSAGEQSDYQRVLSVNPLNVVGGQVYRQPLASGRFVFGDSGYRNGRNQVLYLFTPDYDLTGKKDVYVSYHSLWEQNQDSLGAVEYSIDGGSSWLPIVYLLNSSDIARDEQGNVDAVVTFTQDQSDTALYTDPVTGEERGGRYDAFIGAVVSQDLAPFIRAGLDDNPTDGKRVELFRLPQADNQKRVRLRFAHAGTDSWYFGIDDFGLYSISSSTPIQVAASAQAGRITLTWAGGTGPFQVQRATSLTASVWQDVGAPVSGNSYSEDAAGASGFYRVVGK